MTATIINEAAADAWLAAERPAPTAIPTTDIDTGLARWQPGSTNTGGDWLAGWHYTVTGEGRHVCDGNGRVVAQVVGGTDWREADRIGDLLASSGALATALRELCEVIEGTYLPHELPIGLGAALLGARVALEGANVATE